MMPRAEAEIIIARPPQEVQAFLSDLEKVGPCLAFVDRVERGEKGARWVLRAPFSVVTRTSSLEANLVPEPLGQISWHAQGSSMVWRGGAILSPQEGKTQVRLSLEVQGRGPLRAFINASARLQIGSQLNFFSHQLQEKLKA